MIIKNNFFNEKNEKENILDRESEGIKKAVKKLDERFQNKEIEREKFLKQNEVFAKQHENIKKRKNKLNKNHFI